MKLFTTEARSEKRRLAFTLVEIMVVVGISGILMAVVASLMVNGSRSLLAMTNYTELDRTSRNALDRLTRDIRQGKDVWYYSTNLILLNTVSNGWFYYYYDPNQRTLARYSSSNSGNPEVLLTDCDALKFRISQRNPSNDFTFYPAANISVAKLIDVDWKCSREIRGQKVNTESIQTAKIVIRN